MINFNNNYFETYYMKYFLLVIILLSSTSFSYSNGIWTYAENIRAGVFGLNENNPLGSNYTFNDVVYFNANIFGRSNVTVEGNLSILHDTIVEGDILVDRLVSLTNSSFFVEPFGTSNFHWIRANRIMSPENPNFYLRPAYTSVLRNVNVSGELIYKGQELDERFVREEQLTSITINDLDSSSFESVFVTRTDSFSNPPTCSGDNLALGWTGTSWTCNTIETGGGGGGSMQTGCGSCPVGCTLLSIGGRCSSSNDIFNCWCP